MPEVDSESWNAEFGYGDEHDCRSCGGSGQEVRAPNPLADHFFAGLSERVQLCRRCGGDGWEPNEVLIAASLERDFG